MPSQAVIDKFLDQTHIAVVGVSRKKSHFGNAVYQQLKKAGYAVYPVHPTMETFAGDRCYPSLSAIDGPIDGAMLMVNADIAKEVLRDVDAAAIKRVWLHKGFGPGAVSSHNVAYCRAHGIEVVDGACPLMFLEPVRHVHWIHRLMARKSIAA